MFEKTSFPKTEKSSEVDLHIRNERVDVLTRPYILAIFVVLCAQNYLKMHTLL